MLFLKILFWIPNGNCISGNSNHTHVCFLSTIVSAIVCYVLEMSRNDVYTFLFPLYVSLTPYHSGNMYIIFILDHILQYKLNVHIPLPCTCLIHVQISMTSNGVVVTTISICYIYNYLYFSYHEFLPVLPLLVIHYYYYHYYHTTMSGPPR